MILKMVKGSVDVLTKPSTGTFEKYETDNLTWAVIYVSIGAALSGVFGAIGATMAKAEAVGLIASVIGNVGLTIVAFAIFLGVVYLIATSLFKATGKFGELAFDISLYWAPLAVLMSIAIMLSLGIFAWVMAPVKLVLFCYNLFLTYLGIQAGMNLPRDKALYVILIPLVAVIVLLVLVGLVLGGTIVALLRGLFGL
ncbi:MAG: DUF1282 family protein [Chloroflexaceae bacterium]|nr:DUF1282 family protein [Chloroflexaceae bacterium]